VAGYADSDGYVDADTPRTYAYKYRDYVIRSFNADKPFNQFIVEQLAGDELAGASFTDPHPALTNPQSLEMLIATGFLRMAADGTAADAADQSASQPSHCRHHQDYFHSLHGPVAGLRPMP
jgi:hypothetical protein